MQKQAPSIGRILIAIGFALSCFGLILFLWIAFGGPIPLRPESYRITAYFPEATQLAAESDVRIGGVSVGKVKQIELAPAEYRVDGNDTTAAEIEIEPQFAPISSDARAILRQKTLLGETYVELTPGSQPGTQTVPISLGAAANVSDAEASAVESVPEGGTLGVGHTENATQIDEIFNALDRETRTSFQEWMANSSTAIEGRGLDLNDALGNLGPFVSDSADILEILKRQKASLKGLVRDTGTVFEALTERDGQLASMISNSNHTFDALASQEQALRQLFGSAHMSIIPARVAGDVRAARPVPGQHGPADQGPDPGRARPQPDAAEPARALAEPEEPVHRPRRAGRRLARGPAGAEALPRRSGPGARRARRLPRQPQPRDPLPRLPARHRRRLPGRP